MITSTCCKSVIIRKSKLKYVCSKCGSDQTTEVYYYYTESLKDKDHE